MYEPVPDGSSQTRIRERWVEEWFLRIFERTVQAPIDAKIAKGENRPCRRFADQSRRGRA
ncbi:hypothetical protein D3Y55_19095 [Mesorhizobium sp. DCY119]|nr:hypothetical protein D3Y55_19095 [Mesorhizobium sp. DCY119]